MLLHKSVLCGFLCDRTWMSTRDSVPVTRALEEDALWPRTQLRLDVLRGCIMYKCSLKQELDSLAQLDDVPVGTLDIRNRKLDAWLKSR